MLISNHIKLRTLEPTDIEVMLTWENETDNWLVSQTYVPYSKKILQDYINSAQDLMLHRQIRFVIEFENEAVGCIDLFDYDPVNGRVGLGILIGNKAVRNKGVATESIKMVLNYCREVLLLNQVYCSVLSDNSASFKLFSGLGFTSCGIRKAWQRTKTHFLDEHLFQYVFRD